MKQILITGAGGFIGRNLIEYLSKDITVEKIIAIDNFISSNRDSFIKFIKFHEKVIFYEHDISQEIKINIDYPLHEIYHLASIASPIFYKKYPIETLNVGYLGTKNILEIAKKYNCKILFSSTSEIYGDAKISPQRENYYGNVNSFGERSNYDESKRVAESLCYTYIKLFNLDVKIARIFNTYGPHMLLNDGRIVTQTIKSLMNNTTLQIYGDGNQTRSCCNIFDTIDMLVKLMASNCNIPVNIGNDEERTINDTIDIIEKVYQEHFDECKLKREYIPLTQDDPLKRCPCLKRNKEILGERKYVSFEKGVKEMIQYYID